MILEYTTVDGGLEKKSEACSSEETPDEALDRAFSSINMRLADDFHAQEVPAFPSGLYPMVFSI